MGRFNKTPYPPCTTNPVTEKPYTRHKWVIKDVRVSKNKEEALVHFYHISCSRCGINDPNPPTH